MKIICVGRNYVDHVKELNNEIPTEPVIFLKPETARLSKGKPFVYPEHSNDVHYEAEIVVRIDKNGKHIGEAFASSYYSELTLGLDLTARDTQSNLKKKGLPWELSKAFDNSAILGKFVPKKDCFSDNGISFNLEKNGKIVQQGNSNQMINPIDKLIAFVSKYFFLKQGDLLFTGTPVGVGPIAIGDIYTGYINEIEVLHLKIN